MQRTHLIEEPSALIGLARVCGGAGGQPPALPGSDAEAEEWLKAIEEGCEQVDPHDW